MTDDLIRLSDAAWQLNLSHTQAYRLALRGDLPATKRGERWFVDRKAVERMAAGSRDPEPQAA